MTMFCSQEDDSWSVRLVDVVYSLVIEFISVFAWFGIWLFTDLLTEDMGMELTTSAWTSAVRLAICYYVIN